MLETLLFLFFLLSKPDSPSVLGASSVVLSSHSFSLEERYDNEFVNGVFKDNILLALRYMNGDVEKKEDIEWDEVVKPFHSEFTLKPGESFAFHDQVLAEYSGSIVKTTNAHFNYTDGFKSDGYLTGDGVCHLASLIYWAAEDAGLSTEFFASHDFAKINEVPKEYGVSIKYDPGNLANGTRQNLYIINSLDKPVSFLFDFDGESLSVSVVSND